MCEPLMKCHHVISPSRDPICLSYLLRFPLKQKKERNKNIFSEEDLYEMMSSSSETKDRQTNTYERKLK